MDRIYAKARRVIDGDTIDVDVTRKAADNAHDYGRRERIRLLGLNAPERGTRGAEQARRRLAQRVRGRGLRIDVHARDTYGRLVAKVTLTPLR